MAVSIRDNKDIKGINVSNIEIKISQIADDTTCFVQDVNSIKVILETFETFRLCAGLKLNVDKNESKISRLTKR